MLVLWLMLALISITAAIASTLHAVYTTKEHEHSKHKKPKKANEYTRMKLITEYIGCCFIWVFSIFSVYKYTKHSIKDWKSGGKNIFAHTAYKL